MNTLPYIRCVGIGNNLQQNEVKMAYDYRLICILCGSGNIEINRKSYCSKTGDVYIINPGTPYRVCSFENQKIAVINFDTSYEYLHISNPVLSVNEDVFKTEDVINTPPLNVLENITYKLSPGDIELLEDMYQIYLRDDLKEQLKNFLLSSRFLNIVSSLLTYNKKASGMSAEIYRYVIDNACTKLTAEIVAKRFNYSPSYIEKILRKNYNISLKQLILDTRLKKAVWLLENTSLSCFEISSQLGFYSSQHFAQMFKKKYKQNPTDMR